MSGCSCDWHPCNSTTEDSSLFPQRSEACTWATEEDWVKIVGLRKLVTSFVRAAMGPMLPVLEVLQFPEAACGTMRAYSSSPLGKNTILGKLVKQSSGLHGGQALYGNTVTVSLFAELLLNLWITNIRHRLECRLLRNSFGRSRSLQVAAGFPTLWSRPRWRRVSVLHRKLRHDARTQRKTRRLHL